MAARICGSRAFGALALADTEHCAAGLLDHVRRNAPFGFLVPMVKQKSLRTRLEAIPSARFRPHWAGYATARETYEMVHGTTGPMSMLVQRFGERPGEYSFNSFLCTDESDEVGALTSGYPQRWHIEEFFNAHQAPGWQRAGTQNLNIRYGQMTMALFAQAALDPLRRRLPPIWASWDARQFARKVLGCLQGDIRVHSDTIVVTYYGAPEACRLRQPFEHMPERLETESIDPRIPWLCDFKLDFRFK